MGAVQVTSFGTVDAFLEVAGGFLEEREANHCLSLGVCLSLPRAEPVDGALAAATVDGRVVATIVWTPGHEVVLSEVDNPVALESLAAVVPAAVPAVHAPVEHAERFATLVARRHGRRLERPTHGSRQAIYHVREVRPPAGVVGAFRQATPDDRDVLVDWIVAFAEETSGYQRGPDSHARAGAMLDTPGRTAYLWADPEPVSFCSTFGATPHGIRVSGVYTPPELRRRGYASGCVAAASQAELERGRTFCCLFTDLANPTSNRIYQAIGFRFVREIGWWDLVVA